MNISKEINYNNALRVRNVLYSMTSEMLGFKFNNDELRFYIPYYVIELIVTELDRTSTPDLSKGFFFNEIQVYENYEDSLVLSRYKGVGSNPKTIIVKDFLLDNFQLEIVQIVK